MITMTTEQRVIREHLETIRRWGIRDATIKARRRIITKLSTDLPVPLLKATPVHLADWQRHLDVSVSSISTYSTHVRSFFRWAHDAGHIKTDPAAKLRVPRVPPRLPRPIPEADLALALDTAMEPVRTWLLLSAYCGLRSGEIARLRHGDVDFEARRLSVDGKGGKQRRVPIPEVVLEALRPHLHRGRQGSIWRRFSGGPMTQYEVTRQTTRHFRELGMAWVLHCCRHRFGTMGYADTPDIRVIQVILGHGSCQTTQRYVDWNETKGQDAVDLLAERLKRSHPRTYPDAA